MTAPRPSSAFERHLNRVAGREVNHFPAVVTRDLPLDDCSGPPFNPVRKPSGRIGRDGWQVPAAILAAIMMAGVAGLLSIGWRP